MITFNRYKDKKALICYGRYMIAIYSYERMKSTSVSWYDCEVLLNCLIIRSFLLPVSSSRLDREISKLYYWYLVWLFTIAFRYCKLVKAFRILVSEYKRSDFSKTSSVLYQRSKRQHLRMFLWCSLIQLSIERTLQHSSQLELLFIKVQAPQQGQILS